MTWKVATYSPEDGWAVVEHGGQLSLLRPPYSHIDMVQITPEALPRLLAQPGFIQPDDAGSVFAALGDLIDFLNARVLASRADRGAALPEAGFGQALLEHAPRDVLVRFLDRVERELIAGGLLERAHKALTAFIGLQSVMADNALHRQALALLTRIGSGGTPRKNLVGQAFDIRSRFPGAVAAYGESGLRGFCAVVQSRCSLFGLAAGGR
jgi:hypothetical protein